jgi:hypothetical protein
MKIIITEQQYNKAIDKYLTYVFEPHEENTLEEYPGSIFWMKNGEIVAEIEKSKNFWIHNDIWDKVSILFSLENDDIQQVIKQWLEEHYGLGESPYMAGFRWFRM